MNRQRRSRRICWRRPLRAVSAKLPGSLRKNDQLSLLRIELERRIRADNDRFAILVLHVLADREHANIAEYRLRHDIAAGRLGGFVVAISAHDVDVIVRQDETTAWWRPENRCRSRPLSCRLTAW